MALNLTVTQLQQRIATEVDQSSTTPTVGGNEWALRLLLLNRAQDEWSAAHDWGSLRKVHVPTVTGVSQASISLPGDFKVLAGPAKVYFTGMSGGENWPLIKHEEIEQQDDTINKWSAVIGNPQEGFTLLWNPGTLASGATLEIPYYAVATSLASPADITQIGQPEFLVKRASGWLWRIRNDDRAAQAEFEAREMLFQARENDLTQPFPVDDRVETNERLYHSFRWGRD